MTVLRSRGGRAKRPVIAIIIEQPMWRTDSDVLRKIRRAALIAAAAAPAGGGQRSSCGEISILLSDDRRLRQLNSQFRQRAKTTNVLAFPAAPELAPYFGDIALAYGVVRKEASSQRKSFAAHAAHLAVHGVLHLLGYDHEQSDDAETMERLEISILNRIGIDNPYGAAPIRNGQNRPKFKPCLTTPAQ